MVETLKISTLIYVEKRENGATTMFKEIMDGTFPELMKGVNPHIQEAYMQSKLHSDTW